MLTLEAFKAYWDKQKYAEKMEALTSFKAANEDSEEGFSFKVDELGQQIELVVLMELDDAVLIQRLLARGRQLQRALGADGQHRLIGADFMHIDADRRLRDAGLRECAGDRFGQGGGWLRQCKRGR